MPLGRGIDLTCIGVDALDGTGGPLGAHCRAAVNAIERLAGRRAHEAARAHAAGLYWSTVPWAESGYCMLLLLLLHAIQTFVPLLMLVACAHPRLLVEQLARAPVSTSALLYLHAFKVCSKIGLKPPLESSSPATGMHRKSQMRCCSVLRDGVHC